MKLTLAPIAAGLASADAVMPPSATLAATLAAAPEGFLVPRSFEDRPLARRDGICRDGSHNCLEIHRGDKCCEDTDYCYVDKAGEPQCCPIGSNCVDTSVFKSDRYFCTTDITVGGSLRTRTTGCCGRSCPQTSFYLCPESFGGSCCPYGAQCRSDGNCVKTKTGADATGTGTGTDTGTAPRTVDPEPPGDSLSDSRLSAGAKAGIGIGVAAPGCASRGAGARAAAAAAPGPCPRRTCRSGRAPAAA